MIETITKHDANLDDAGKGVVIPEYNPLRGRDINLDEIDLDKAEEGAGKKLVTDAPSEELDVELLGPVERPLGYADKFGDTTLGGLRVEPDHLRSEPLQPPAHLDTDPNHGQTSSEAFVVTNGDHEM